MTLGHLCLSTNHRRTTHRRGHVLGIGTLPPGWYTWWFTLTLILCWYKLSAHVVMELHSRKHNTISRYSWFEYRRLGGIFKKRTSYLRHWNERPCGRALVSYWREWRARARAHGGAEWRDFRRHAGACVGAYTVAVLIRAPRRSVHDRSGNARVLRIEWIRCSAVTTYGVGMVLCK